MPDYKAMYFRLAGRLADVVDILIEAQQEGEQMALEEDCPAVEIADN